MSSDFATMEIKALAASVLSNFDLEVVAGQEIIQEYEGPGSPKNGVRVHVKRRDNLA